MAVTINSADGTTPSVVITGPDSYSNTINTSQTLSGLTLGLYTIVADSADGPDAVIGTVTDTGAVTGSPATVTASMTVPVTVTYAAKRRVGGLWVANNSNPTIPELASNQLRSSGRPVPAETLATKVSSPAGLALDPDGNMWESSNESDTILMYSLAARNAGGGAAPSTVLVSTALDIAQMIAFDPNGNLWVANYFGSNLLEFTAGQLANGGTQTPYATISGGAILGNPVALAFDGNGNAWVSDGFKKHIVKYSAAQLAVAGASTPTPIDTVGEYSGTLSGTVGLAFDPNGNLWVANNGSNTVVEYTPAQLAAEGSPTPNAIITLPAGATPFGIAFDKRGTLWVSSRYNGVMYGLTSAQLTTGAPTPAVADTVSLSGGFLPEQPLFDPYITDVGASAARLRHPVAALAQTRHANPNLRRPMP